MNCLLDTPGFRRWLQKDLCDCCLPCCLTGRPFVTVGPVPQMRTMQRSNRRQMGERKRAPFRFVFICHIFKCIEIEIETVARRRCRWCSSILVLSNNNNKKNPEKAFNSKGKYVKYVLVRAHLLKCHVKCGQMDMKWVTPLDPVPLSTTKQMCFLTPNALFHSTFFFFIFFLFTSLFFAQIVEEREARIASVVPEMERTRASRYRNIESEWYLLVNGTFC